MLSFCLLLLQCSSLPIGSGLRECFCIQSLEEFLFLQSASCSYQVRETAVQVEICTSWENIAFKTKQNHLHLDILLVLLMDGIDTALNTKWCL